MDEYGAMETYIKLGFRCLIVVTRHFRPDFLTRKESKEKKKKKEEEEGENNNRLLSLVGRRES